MDALDVVLGQEHCDDAIGRQLVLDYIYNDLGLGDEENGKDIERQMELESFYRYIKSLPPVQPKLKTGYWVEYAPDHHKCSNCNKNPCVKWNNAKRDNVDILTDYCPNCGIKMVEMIRMK